MKKKGGIHKKNIEKLQEYLRKIEEAQKQKK